jgi:hypothetical protein
MKALLSFIETSTFTTRVLEFLSDEDYAKLQWLRNHPDASDLIASGGGIRKIRWGIALSRFSDYLPLVVELELRGAL